MISKDVQIIVPLDVLVLMVVHVIVLNAKPVVLLERIAHQHQMYQYRAPLADLVHNWKQMTPVAVTNALRDSSVTVLTQTQRVMNVHPVSIKRKQDEHFAFRVYLGRMALRCRVQIVKHVLLANFVKVTTIPQNSVILAPKATLKTPMDKHRASHASPRSTKIRLGSRRAFRV